MHTYIISVVIIVGPLRLGVCLLLSLCVEGRWQKGQGEERGHERSAGKSANSMGRGPIQV